MSSNLAYPPLLRSTLNAESGLSSTPDIPYARQSIIKVTWWRLFNTSIVLAFGISKVIASESVVIKGLDIAIGLAWVLISYWASFLETATDCPKIVAILFQTSINQLLAIPFYVLIVTIIASLETALNVVVMTYTQNLAVVVSIAILPIFIATVLALVLHGSGYFEIYKVGGDELRPAVVALQAGFMLVAYSSVFVNIYLETKEKSNLTLVTIYTALSLILFICFVCNCYKTSQTRH